MTSQKIPPMTPLGEVLKQLEPKSAAVCGEAAIAAPAATPLDLAALDLHTIEQILMHHRQPSSKAVLPSMAPEMKLKLAGIITAGFVVITGLWLYRPVHTTAQAQITQDLSAALLAQQAQVSQAIESAKPNQYKCNALFGGCHFPEQVPAVVQLPEALEHIEAIPVPQPVADPWGMATAVASETRPEDLALDYLRDWTSQGVDSAKVADYIRHLHSNPDPDMPSAEAFALAYRRFYGV